MAVRTTAEMPGPDGGRVLGNLTDFSEDPLGFLTHCADEYGDVVRISPKNVLLVSPEHAVRMLVDRGSDFVKQGPGTRSAGRRQSLPLSTMSSDGEEWKVRRRRIHGAFGRELSADAAAAMREQADRMLAPWRPGQVRDLQQDVSVVTLRLVTRLMFGEEYTDEEIADVAGLVAPIMDLSTSPVVLPEWVPTPPKLRIRRHLKRVLRTLERVAASPKAADPEAAPVLHALLHDTPAPSEAEIRDELATLLMAGFETTNDAVVWASVLLARHPEAAERVHSEAEKAYAGDADGMAMLNALPFTDAVLRESLRLYSPVWITSRDARVDVDFADYLIPAGTTVTVSQWINHRDSRYWRDADSFIPERWLGKETSEVPRGSYFPFGLGPRTCVGAALSTVESVLLLAAIWSAYRLRLNDPAAVRPRPALALQPMNARFVLERW
ncbi:cytochrome P450 [Streptomyces sp. ATCC 21386]|uniref:cytochrome P450 n=1 Tax=Streptomyces sp. ATCC 21386 TaxID=2699428 RepID=UPI001BFF7F8C|nr:cytochrome P450 [Streptomyces sp. ATCC 21386]